MSDIPVLYEMRGVAAWITINRPERRNALNDTVVLQIAEGMRRAEAEGARAIVITGAGDRAFCAGGDLQRDSDAFAYDLSRPSPISADMLRVAHALTVPLLARVNGHCMAGGMALLGMCDLAVASDAALFGLPEVKVGLFPMQVLSVLQSIVPQRVLAEMCLTGEPISAEAAHAAGLLNYVVPAQALDEKVDWLLSRLADKSPTAQRRGRFAMNAARAMSFEQAIAYLEGQIALLALTEDGVEGRKAFAEKRPPHWTGR